MENTSIPHSLPKPTFFSNSNSDVALPYPSHSHKSQSVYDGVFNAPPKFGIPTLAPPRLQDYSEIFGGFHSSRSSAIPFLHLPLPPHHDSHLPSNLRRLSFDYSDVFGGGFSFTASFQDLFGQFGAAGYQSPDHQWSPAQSETPSDELDPLAGCDKNSILSDAEFHHSLGSIKTMLNNASGHVRNLSAVPPYTFTQYESSVSWHGNEKHCPVNEPDDIDCIEEFGEWVITETKQAKYCLSKSLHGGFNDAHVNEFNPSAPSAKPFMTVSDISLRTKPSQLPPPSRPPPPLGVKLNERVVCDVAPLLFDVKGDDAVFAEGCRKRDESVKVDPESDTETVDSMDMCSLDALRLSCCEGERIFVLHGEENASCVPINEDGTASRKSTGDASESWGLLGFNHYTLETDGAAAERDATGYIEINANQINKQPFNMVDGCDTVMQEMTQDSHRHDRPIDHGEFNQKDISKKFIRSKEVPENNPTVRIQQTIWDEEMNPSEMSGEHCDLDGKLQQGKETTMSEDQKLRKLGNICDSSQTAENFQALGESEILQMKQSGILERQPKAMINVCEVETKLKLEAFPEQLDVKETFLSSQVTEQNTGKYRQSALGVECWRRFEYVGGDPTCERVKRAETEETEKQYSCASEKESDNRLTETFKRKEGGLILKEDYKDVDSADNSYRVLGQEVCGDEHPQGVEEDNESLMESGKQKATESSHREAVEDTENDKEHRLVHEWEEREGRCGDTSQTEYHGVRCRVVEKKAGNEEESLEAKGTLNLGRDPGMQAKLKEFPEEVKPTEMNDYKRELKTDPNDEGDRLKTSDGRYKLDGEGHRELKTVPSCIIYEAEAEGDDTLDKEKFNELCKKKYGLQDADTYIASCEIVDSHGLPKPMKDSSLYENMGVPCVVPEKTCSQSNHSLGAESITSTRDGRCAKIKGTQISNKSEDNGDSFTRHHEVRKFPTYVNKVEDAPSTLEHIEKALYSIKSAHSQRVETKDKNVKENLATKDQKGWERMKREIELENDHMRKLEEEREREREREKDRMAVDKLALQGHERLYAEAHERAERAAAERTTVELRLRRMASTRERLEKPSVQARLRAERAATERGTSEAWSRAAEKFSAQEARSDIHDRAEKNVAVRFHASFRSDDNRQSSLASDLHFQNTGNSNILLYSHASAPFGAEGESPQRCKARTERYKRTAERAANALAEKNRRDLLAQKEREERNRVAEVLDAEIRRWSNGKEGNLRALLSTLQYILGPDSGWQPVPLTEVITSAAVKRSYRKATLCVHPDKLQQRGATIQQKYISEKVFDLLKEAWNKFNAEER